MSHHSRLLRWLTLVVAAATLATAAHAAPRKILLLIADDFGIDSAEFYPTTIRRVTTPSAPPMPNLKRLARSGVLFRTAWANPICAPSRATIFTGRYSFRTGVAANPHDDPEFAELSQDEFILPEAFRARSALGYVLAHIGKWHVSRGATDPNRLGWPYFAGGVPGAPGVPGYFSWTKYVNNTSTTSTTYATTDQVNETLGVIRRARKQGRPYFIEVTFNAPHSPFHKPPNALHSRDALPKYEPGLDRRPYYEAMVEALDTEIGRLMQEINLSNTKFMFLF
jgi:arylsulfatase A-like enzyme